jgi:hypothetical protein
MKTTILKLFLPFAILFGACGKQAPPPQHRVGAVLGNEFWTLPNGYDPSVSGQLAAVGDIYQSADGTKAWQRSGTNNTDWVTTPPVGGGGTSGLPDGGVTAPLSGLGTAANPVTVAAGAITGTSLIKPLVLSDSTSGINPILTLTVPTAGTGDPALYFKAGAAGTTVEAYIRASDADHALTLVPGAGGFGSLVTPGESQIRFSWSTAGLAFFGGGAAAKQAVGVALTNGASGGTASTIATFAGSTYATDSSAILGDINQLAIKVNLLDAALKAYTLVSN